MCHFIFPGVKKAGPLDAAKEYVCNELEVVVVGVVVVVAVPKPAPSFISGEDLLSHLPWLSPPHCVWRRSSTRP